VKAQTAHTGSGRRAVGRARHAARGPTGGRRGPARPHRACRLGRWPTSPTPKKPMGARAFMAMAWSSRGTSCPASARL
jgi:hypothetical protein